MAKAVICSKCGNSVLLSQPEDHHEYVPSGKCSSCDALIIMEDHYSPKDAHPVIVS